MKRISYIKKYLNWRIILVRILVNALALGLTVALLPNIWHGSWNRYRDKEARLQLNEEKG